VPGHIENKFIEKLIGTFNGINGVRVISKKSELPNVFKEEAFFYEPDVVILVDKKITHVVEVETDPVRKALVGGACTCAYFVKKNLSNVKPKLYFAIGDKGLNQLHRFQARKKILEDFFKMYFSDIQIDSQQQILELLKKDLHC